MASVWLGDVQPYNCEVHPSVPMTILQHTMRKTSKTRSFGVVYGHTAEGSVSMHQALPINQLPDEKNIISEQNKLRNHIRIFKEAYPKYSPIGIYSTGNISAYEILTLQYFEKEITQTTGSFFLLNVNFSSEVLEVQCFRLVRYTQLSSLAYFQPIPSRVIRSPLGVFVTKKQELGDLVRACHEYVKQVESGQTRPDPYLATLLSRAINYAKEVKSTNSKDLQLISEITDTVINSTEKTDEVQESL